MNDKSIQLLQDVSQNAEMGKILTDEVLAAAETPQMKDCLQAQAKTYDDIRRRAYAQLAGEGIEQKETGVMKTGWAQMMVRVKAIADNSPRALAELMMEGCHMGATQALESIRDTQGAEEEPVHLATSLMQQQEQYVQDFKQFI